jgi:hypothetical protein
LTFGITKVGAGLLLLLLLQALATKAKQTQKGIRIGSLVICRAC